MVQNIKLKCKCASVLISSPLWTSITLARQVVCTWAVAFSPQRQAVSRAPRGAEPKQDANDDTWLWTRLRWMLNSVRRQAWEMSRRERVVLTCGGSAQHYCAISNFMHREIWTATCELFVNTDKQAKLQVRSLRIHLFTCTHIYHTVCVCASSTTLNTQHVNKDWMYPHPPALPIHCNLWVERYKSVTVFAIGRVLQRAISLNLWWNYLSTAT